MIKNHKKLINLIYNNLDVIDRAYNGENIVDIESKLIQSRLFIKIDGIYKLNSAYVSFMDTMLGRIDASIIFSDYSKELITLSKLKESYEETNNEYYLQEIIHLIESIYLNFENKNQNITSLVSNLVADNDLDIDIQIKRAEDSLEKLEKIIEETKETREHLNEEIIGLSLKIDHLCFVTKAKMTEYSTNIKNNINKLEEYIRRSKNKKEQNSKLMSLSYKLINHKRNRLDDILQAKTQDLHFTFTPRKAKVKVHIDFAHISQNKMNDNAILRLKEQVRLLIKGKNLKKPKPPKVIVTEQKVIERKIVSFDKIINDLEVHKPTDLYNFIRQHEEIKKFMSKEVEDIRAFETFLKIVTRKGDSLNFTDRFNEDKVRSIKWI